MSPNTRQKISMGLGLLLLAGVAYGLYLATKAIIHGVRSLDSDIAVAIISAGALTLVSVLSIVLGKVYEAQELIQKEHRDKKIPVYEIHVSDVDGHEDRYSSHGERNARIHV